MLSHTVILKFKNEIISNIFSNQNDIKPEISHRKKKKGGGNYRNVEIKQHATEQSQGNQRRN